MNSKDYFEFFKEEFNNMNTSLDDDEMHDNIRKVMEIIFSGNNTIPGMIGEFLNLQKSRNIKTVDAMLGCFNTVNDIYIAFCNKVNKEYKNYFELDPDVFKKFFLDHLGNELFPYRGKLITLKEYMEIMRVI